MKMGNIASPWRYDAPRRTAMLHPPPAGVAQKIAAQS
jgi:hypothetical protein